ncbi:MAG: PAS domain S-box protein, partial [Gammaproteobacteria bacterium]
MKYSPNVSLRYLVPLVIILAAILVIGFQYFATKPVLLKTIENDAKEDARSLLNRIQGPIETLLRYDNLDAAKSVIASFGAEQGLESLFLVNAQGKIIAATKLTLLNKQWGELSKYQDSDLVAYVLDTRGTKTKLSVNKQRIFGYSSICAGQDVQIIRPKDCGYLYYRQNINNKKVVALNRLNKEIVRESLGIGSAAFLVWLVIYLRLTHRVEQLITTGNKFMLGDQNARTRIKGADELASLGYTFNTMLDKIVTDEKALSKSEARLRAIVDTAVEGIISIDNSGIIQSFNPTAEKIFAYSANEVVGKNVSMLMPKPYQLEHDSYIQNYLTSGVAKIIGIGRELEGKRKDGTIFPIWLSISEFFENKQQFFTGFIQ